MAAARVDEEPYRQRKVRLLRKEFDVLPLAVFQQHKIVRSEILHHPPVCIVDRREKRNNINSARNRGPLLRPHPRAQSNDLKCQHDFP